MGKIYKVVSKLVVEEYHKLNGEYIDDGTSEEIYEPIVHFDSREKAMTECERVVDKFLNSVYTNGFIKDSDKPEIKESCMTSLEKRNSCVISKACHNLVLKLSEIAVS